MGSVEQRPAGRDDIPRVFELAARFDRAWFGALEHDEDEIAEYFDVAASLQVDSRLFFEGDRLIAVAFRHATDSWMMTDPDQDVTRRVADELIAWYAASDNPKIEALDRDAALRAALVEHGWRHVRSSFELVRPVTDDWTLAHPVWPDGVDVRNFSPADAAAMHRLIYVDAGWAEVPGHPDRGFEDWRRLFITDTTVPELQTLAWRGDRLVGVATGRIFSDGTGWVAQLAVAKDERGNGLGRALLLEALRRRRAAGATALGLSVQAENRNALGLYLSAGLEIDREWMEYRPS